MKFCILIIFICMESCVVNVFSANLIPRLIRPIISLQEIQKKNGNSVEMLGDSDRDFDIILNEENLIGKKLELVCRAHYPVVWIYKGDGLPNLQVTTGVSSVHGLFSESKEYEAYGTVGFSRNPMEIDTGNYSCQNIQDSAVFTSFYVFLAGKKIFVQTQEQIVIYTEKDTTLRIPCSVSHPDAKLSLQKLMNGVAEFPLNESIAYDPKFGFLLYIPDFSNVEGTYLCTAALEGRNSSEKVNVIKHSAISTCADGPCQSCSSLQCGEHTTCKVFNGDMKCSCLPGFSGNPTFGCFDLKQTDSCNEVCGINTECHNNIYVKEIRCRCLRGFMGDPYNGCRKEEVSQYLTTPQNKDGNKNETKHYF